MTEAVPKHPATFPPDVLTRIGDLLEAERVRTVLDPFEGEGVRTVLDPFAGVGGIHELRSRGFLTLGVELEPEWAAASPFTIPGDATRLPFTDRQFDAVATSPAYGNRLADAYDGRDGSTRYTYRIALGRALTAGNGGGLQWGGAYRDLHRRAWAECARVLKRPGRLILNIKDHIRRGKRQHVTEWHTDTLTALGFELVTAVEVESPGIRHGRNAEARIDAETVALFRLD